jgi:hypothetical protein
MMAWIKEAFFAGWAWLIWAVGRAMWEAGRAVIAIIGVIEVAWAWWIAAFGVSDVLERPDAGTLATRAAGHWTVGALSVLITASALGAHLWATLAALAALYGAWELWQRAVDPDRHQRRVARRWDMAVDWAAVQLGGAATAAGIAQMGLLAGALAALGVALILGSAAIMGRKA